MIPRDPPILAPAIRLAVCVSGGGTSLQNLIDRTAQGRLDASITRVISSRSDAGAIARANAAGIPVTVVERKGQSREAFSTRVFGAVRGADADLVVLAGFLALVTIPPEYAMRVINIHPSLIPAFCGKGFHGAAVHTAVIQSGVKLTGCTVHFADNTYDTGPIISQRAVAVHDSDTPALLAARVFEAECEALPAAISQYARGVLRVEGRRVLHQEIGQTA